MKSEKELSLKRTQALKDKITLKLDKFYNQHPLGLDHLVQRIITKFTKKTS